MSMDVAEFWANHDKETVENENKERESFQEWMQKVDIEVQAQIGLSANDLTDYLYRDAYNDGCNPQSVALDVIANDDTFAMFMELT